MDVEGKYLFEYCYWIMRNKHDADDAFQNIFIRAINNIGKFRGECQLRTWIAKIAQNECNRLLRKRKPVYGESYLADRADDGPSPEDALLADEQDVAAAWAIGQLPDEFRRPVVLLRQDHNYSDIAYILDIPIGTVKSRINRANKRLVVLLADFQP
jgi:RNA polymerase sigma-70 factor (ECF subfamily)